MDFGHRDVLTTALVVLPLVFASGARADVAAEGAAVAGPEIIAHAVIGPVLTSDGATAKGDREIPWRKIGSSEPIAARAREVELALRDAAQDLGLAVDYGAPLAGDGVRDADLVKSAAGGHWAISPRIEQVGGDSFVLRMVAVPPKSPTMLVRVDRTDGAHLATRAAIILRDFVQMKLGAGPSPIVPEEKPPEPEEETRRSRGRPVLAVSSTLFGLYTAFAIHRVSGRDDPRLLYPLLALGSGIGLGASLLVADEWNVTPGDAWTIAAGSWWGVVAGTSWAAGRDIHPADDRFAWGLAGGLVGTTAAAAWTAIHRFDDGGATLVHSGAALGTFTGGLTDLLIRGTLKESPASGAGLGAGLGFLGGGVLAMFVQTSAQRVMLVDLGAGLGALAGASVASPLVFKTETEPRTRLFLASVLGGTVVGGTIAWLATRDAPPKSSPARTATTKIFPTIGPLGTPEIPGYGAGLLGIF